MFPSDLNSEAETKGGKDMAEKNDDVFGCARSAHFRNFRNHHSEYHPLKHKHIIHLQSVS